MTRKKVKLAYIASDSARKATFKKRKKGLIKKVTEISTLCGIDACAIIYSPYDAEPEVWPSHLEAQRVIAKFRRMSELEQSKKMVNQESYIRQRISKAEEQLRKQQKENRHKHTTHVMFACLVGEGPSDMKMPDLNDLGLLLDQNIKDIQRRIRSLKEETQPQGIDMIVRHETRESGVEASLATDFIVNPMQDYPWHMDLANPNPQLGDDGTMLPYIYNNKNDAGPSFRNP